MNDQDPQPSPHASPSTTTAGLASRFSKDNGRVYQLLREEPQQLYYRLRIIRQDGKNGLSVYYDDIDVIEHDTDGSAISLFMGKTGLIIHIKGRNLLPLLERLETCAIDKIYTFNPALYDQTDPASKEPVITAIVFDEGKEK